MLYSRLELDAYSKRVNGHSPNIWSDFTWNAEDWWVKASGSDKTSVAIHNCHPERPLDESLPRPLANLLVGRSVGPALLHSAAQELQGVLVCDILLHLLTQVVALEQQVDVRRS